VPEFQQVLGHHRTSSPVVVDHLGKDGMGEWAGSDHHRDDPGSGLEYLAIAGTRCERDDGIHLTTEKVIEDLGEPQRIVLRLGDDRHHSMNIERGGEAMDDGCDEGVSEIRHHHADCQRAAGLQPAGHHVRPVSEPFGDLDDPLACRVLDEMRVNAVERP
jgi:hypothetical protein